MNDATKDTSPEQQAQKAYRQSARRGEIAFISSFSFVIVFIPVSGEFLNGMLTGYIIGAGLWYWLHLWTLDTLDPARWRYLRLKQVCNAQPESGK